MQMRTFTENGITVSAPAGYCSLSSYYTVLCQNLESITTRPNRFRTPESTASLIAEYNVKIALVKQALAI